MEFSISTTSEDQSDRNLSSDVIKISSTNPVPVNLGEGHLKCYKIDLCTGLSIIAGLEILIVRFALLKLAQNRSLCFVIMFWLGVELSLVGGELSWGSD